MQSITLENRAILKNLICSIFISSASIGNFMNLGRRRARRAIASDTRTIL